MLSSEIQALVWGTVPLPWRWSGTAAEKPAFKKIFLPSFLPSVLVINNFPVSPISCIKKSVMWREASQQADTQSCEPDIKRPGERKQSRTYSQVCSQLLPSRKDLHGWLFQTLTCKKCKENNKNTGVQSWKERRSSERNLRAEASALKFTFFRGGTEKVDLWPGEGHSVPPDPGPRLVRADRKQKLLKPQQTEWILLPGSQNTRAWGWLW